MMQFDTIIEGATIYDGTGHVPVRNDLGIKDGKIAAIGRLGDATAEKRIDARHLSLAPGFIDVHSHADMTIHRPEHPEILEPLVRQGITTFVGGNCGVGMAPVAVENHELQMTFYDFFLGENPEPLIHWQGFGEYLEILDNQGVLLNTAVLAPHGIIRGHVMGDSTERATPPEVDEMKNILSGCLEEGAVGMSTGLMYYPGLSCDQWELTELGRVVHDFNGVFTSHLRSYNSDTLGYAIDEVLGVGRDAQVPVQISHLFWVPNFPKPLDKISKAVIKGASAIYKRHPFPAPLESSTKPHLEKIAKLVQDGVPIGVDAMPTTAGFTHLAAFFPPWSLEGGWEKIKERISNPSSRAKIRKSIEEGEPVWPHREGDSWSMNFFKVMGWDCAFIMSVPSEKNSRLIGRSIVSIAEERGVHPFDAACELLLEESGRVLIFETATYPGDPLVELSLKGTLLDPNVSIVTDTILLGFGLPSHLFYDCYPKFLGSYVREGGYISMAQAIRKCTSLPASQLGIANRGILREGYWADLVLFDESTIKSCSTVSDPRHFPEGVNSVFINGHAVVDPDGFHPEPRPGQVIRRGQS